MLTKEPFSHKILIPFHLVDAAGVLFFSHVFTLAHQTFEHFITQELQLKWETWFQNPEWMVPIKQASAEYLSPLFAGKSCSVRLFVKEMRSSSFTLGYQFHQSHSLCCSLHTSHVFCNKVTKKAQEIPSEIYPLLKAFELEAVSEFISKLEKEGSEGCLC